MFDLFLSYVGRMQNIVTIMNHLCFLGIICACPLAFLQTLPSVRKMTHCTYRNIQTCWQNLELLLSHSCQHLCLQSCRRRWWFSAPVLFPAILAVIAMKAGSRVHLISFNPKEESIRPYWMKLHLQRCKAFQTKCTFIALKWGGSAHTVLVVEGRPLHAVIVGVAEVHVHATYWCHMLLWFSWESCFCVLCPQHALEWQSIGIPKCEPEHLLQWMYLCRHFLPEKLEYLSLEANGAWLFLSTFLIMVCLEFSTSQFLSHSYRLK